MVFGEQRVADACYQHHGYEEGDYRPGWHDGHGVVTPESADETLSDAGHLVRRIEVEY